MIRPCQRDDFRSCFTLLLVFSAHPHPSISVPPASHPTPFLWLESGNPFAVLLSDPTQAVSGSLHTSPSVLVPSFPSLSLFSLFCFPLSSLSPRRLLQTLWRICPNYLSYWQLRVNKPGKYVAFSVSHSLPPSLFPSLSPPLRYLVSLQTSPPLRFNPSHLSPISFFFLWPQPQSPLLSFFASPLPQFSNRTMGRPGKSLWFFLVVKISLLLALWEELHAEKQAIDYLSFSLWA